MFFHELTPRRRELLLVGLMTLSWTMCAMVMFVGWICDDRKWYFTGFAFLFVGLSFLETFRHLRAPEADGETPAVD